MKIISKTRFIVILLLLAVSLLFESVYRSFIFGPYEWYDCEDNMQEDRLSNFRGGTESIRSNNEFNATYGLRPSRVYVADLSRRWAPIQFCYIYSNSYTYEYSLSRQEAGEMAYRIQEDGFSELRREISGDLLMFGEAHVYGKTDGRRFYQAVAVNLNTGTVRWIGVKHFLFDCGYNEGFASLFYSKSNRPVNTVIRTAEYVAERNNGLEWYHDFWER